MIWTDKIAIYAAILATILFVKDIVLVIVDRPRIDVKCYEGKRVKVVNKNSPQGYSEILVDATGGHSFSSPNGEILSSKDLIFVSASNHSRRPVTLVNWGVGYKEGGYLTASPPKEKLLPYRLEEGEGYTLWVNKKEFLEELKKTSKTPSYVFVKTADGKVFKRKGFPIKE